MAASPAAAVIGGAVERGKLADQTLMILNSNGGVCSAVVVADDVLATAAHCVTGAPEHRAHYRAADGTPILLELPMIAVHPGYDPDAIRTRRRSIDLALVRLASPLPSRFSPAIFATGTASEGATVVLAGYGLTEESETARASGALSAISLSVVEPYGPSSILLWLAATDGGLAGGCQGDSGGPIIHGDAVIALATWTTGPTGRSCGSLSQGVRLAPQRDWIDATLRQWNRQAEWR